MYLQTGVHEYVPRPWGGQARLIGLPREIVIAQFGKLRITRKSIERWGRQNGLTTATYEDLTKLKENWGSLRRYGVGGMYDFPKPCSISIFPVPDPLLGDRFEVCTLFIGYKNLKFISFNENFFVPLKQDWFAFIEG